MSAQPLSDNSDSDNPGPTGKPKAPAAPVARRSLARRVARIVARTLLVLVLLALAAPFVALELIETDLARDRLRDLAREHGIALDYRALAVRPFSGTIALHDLVVDTPEPLSTVAAHALRLRRLEVRFDPTALVDGRLHVEALELDGVHVHRVVDAEGRDSLALVLAHLVPPEDPDEPTTPLSQTLASIELPFALRAEGLAITDARYEETTLSPEGHRRMLALDGLELRGAARHDGGPLEAELVLRSSDPPARFALVEHDGTAPVTREVAASVEVHATLRDASRIDVRARAELLAQSFDDALELPRDALTLEGSVRFDPARGVVALEVTELALLDRAARVRVRGELPDGAVVPRLMDGGGSIALDALARAAPSELGLFAEGGSVTFTLHEEPEGSARLELRGRAARLGTSSPVSRVDVEDLALELDASLAPEHVRATLRAPIAAVRASSLAGSAELFDATVAIHRLELASADGGALRWDEVLAAVGRVEASIVGESLRARSDDVPSAELARVRVEARATLAGTPVWSPELVLAVGETRLALVDGTRVRLDPLAASLTTSDVTADFTRPARYTLEATLPRAELDGPSRTRVEDVRLSVRGTARSLRSLAGELTLRTASLLHSEPRSVITLRPFELRASIAELTLDPSDWARTTVSFTLEPRTERIELRDELGGVLLEGLAPRLRGRYGGTDRSNVAGTIALGTLRMTDGPTGAYETVLEPGELTLDVDDLAIDAARPLRSRVSITARSAHPHLDLELIARSADGHGEGTVTLRAQPAGALLRPLPEGLDLDRAALDVRARATWHGLDARAPSIDQHVEASLTQVAFARPGVRLDAPRVALTLDHRARGPVHDATARVLIDPPTIDDALLEGALELRAEARLDRAARAVHVDARVTGPRELAVALRADGTFDADGTLHHTAQLELARLSALEGLVPASTRVSHPLDYHALAMTMQGSGRIPHFATPALDALVEWSGTLQQSLTATVSGLRYTPEGVVLTVPELQLRADIDETPDSLGVVGHVDVERLDFEDPSAHWTVRGVSQNLRLRSRGPLSQGRLVLELDGGIRRVQQDLIPAYPMAELALTARFRMDGFESMELRRLSLVNPRGGTQLELRKTLDRVGAAVDGERSDLRGSQHLVLSGRLEQDLARIDRAPGLLRASGRMEAPFTVTSGDGSLFRITGSLDLHGVALELPQLGLGLEGVEARVPVEEAVVWTPETGFSVLPSTQRNPFARVRFQDVQPFLRDESYVEIERARWGEVELGRMVGSLRIDRNLLSLGGVRIERDGALITGEILVDYLPGEERIHFRGNVTGLRPRGTDEPLDANAAIVFDPNRLELDGRVQIVRLGGRHLVELLDMIDPYRENGSLNRLRGALEWGHPQRVSLALSRGLLSMDVALGGLIGSLIQIGEIRGIALGPFMTRHVAPYLNWEEP